MGRIDSCVPALVPSLAIDGLLGYYSWVDLKRY